MSSGAISPTTTIETDKPAPPRRGLIRRILGETFSRWGARIGIVWIGLLVFLAVFAPVIANSHPLLMKKDGEWSSPMLQHLGPMDVVLFVLFFAGLVLLALRRLPVKLRWRIFGLVLVLAAIPSFIFIEAPDVVVGGYERYREWQADDKVEQVIFAPIPYSPNDRLRDRQEIAVFGPWWAGEPHNEYNHWLGQDQKRQDVASRMIHAARIALAIGFIATGIAIVIGVVIGGLMGYFSKLIDLLGMRLVEVFEFIPQLYLLLMFVAFFPADEVVVFGIAVQRIYMIMVIIGLTSWAGYARFVRAEYLKLRNQDFVMAARACGLPLRSILFRHMLPNGLTPVLVSASFGVARAILLEATLSFLGLGLIEEPSWGGLLNQATRGARFLWWIATFPGLAIFLTVFAYNMIGESLRDAIDPHTQRLKRGGG